MTWQSCKVTGAAALCFLSVLAAARAAETSAENIGSQAEAFSECTIERCDTCLQHSQESLRNLTVLLDGDVAHHSPLRIGRSLTGQSTRATYAQIIGIIVAEVLGIAVEYTDCEDDQSCYSAVQRCIGWRDHQCDKAEDEEAAREAHRQGRKLYPDVLADVMFMTEVASHEMSADQETSRLYQTAKHGPVEACRLGPAGFTTQDGLYVFPEAIDRAWDAGGVDLTSYRSYTLQRGVDYFDKPSRLIADGVPENATSCNSPSRSDTLSGLDWACEASWWLSPGCAAAGGAWKDACAAMLINEWRYRELFRAIATSGMRVAMLRVSEEAFETLVAKRRGLYNVIFAWWSPDATYAQHEPVRISLPHAAEVIPNTVVKVGWRPAVNSESPLHNLLSRASLSPGHMLKLVEDISALQMQGHRPGPAMYQKVACDWIRRENHTVEEWFDPLWGCSSGQLLDDATHQCRQCQPGTAFVRDKDHVPRCVECKPGTYSHSLASMRCRPCPVGSYNPLAGQERCALCPDGADCRSEGTATFRVQTGHAMLVGGDSVLARWSALGDEENSSASYVASAVGKRQGGRGFEGVGPFKCETPGACRGNNTCAEGMAGPLCGQCQTGYVRRNAAEQCVLCPEPVGNALATVGIFGAILVAVLLQDRLNKVSSGSRDVASSVPKILSNLLIVMSAASQAIKLEETLLATVVANSWIIQSFAAPVKLGNNAGEVMEDPTRASYSVSCFLQKVDRSGLPAAYLQVVCAWILIPAGMLFLAVLSMAIAVFTRRRKKRNEKKQKTRNKSLRFPSLQAPDLSELSDLSRISLSHWRHAGEIFKPKAIVLAYVLHPTVTSMFLATFRCMRSDVSESRLAYDAVRLQSDMSIVCHSDEHIMWMAIAGTGIAIWSFGIPIFFAVSLYIEQTTGRHSLASGSVRRTYGFLYLGFEDHKYWYESIFMMRKVIVLIVATQSFTEKEHTRLVILLFVELLFFAFHLHIEPFDNRAYKGLDRLQTCCCITLVFLLTAGVLMNEESQEMKAISYLPAFALFSYTMADAGYLLLRQAIWPLYKPCRLPHCLRWSVGARMRMTLIPLGNELTSRLVTREPSSPAGTSASTLNTEADAVKEVDLEPVLVGHCTGCECGLGRRWDKSLKVCAREEDLLKDVFATILETLLARHSLFANNGEVPGILSLPSLMLQMERLFVASYVAAIRKRVRCYKDDVKALKNKSWSMQFKSLVGMVRQGVFEKVNSIVRGEMTQTDSQIDDSKTGVTKVNLTEKDHLFLDPVSIEELHLAMHELNPKLLDNDESNSTQHLTYLMQNSRHYFEGISNVGWLFDKETHSDISLRRRPRTKSTASSRSAKGKGAAATVSPRATVTEDARPSESNPVSGEVSFDLCSSTSTSEDKFITMDIEEEHIVQDPVMGERAPKDEPLPHCRGLRSDKCQL